MPLSLRTRSRIWMVARYWRLASGTDSAALSSCFCSSRWMRARSWSFLSMTLMTSAISSRVRSDSVTGSFMELYPLHQHDRAPLVVVERALPARQLPHAHFVEAAFDEPVLRPRGEHEQALQLSPARARLDLGQEPLAGAGVAELGMHDETGKLSCALV